MNWQSLLDHDPIAPLLSSQDKALDYFVRRDLLDETVPSIEFVWGLPAAQKILKKQQPDGSWKYPGTKKPVYPEHHYGLVETWKKFRFLIDTYREPLELEGWLDEARHAAIGWASPEFNPQ